MVGPNVTAFDADLRQAARRVRATTRPAPIVTVVWDDDRQGFRYHVTDAA